MRKSTKKSTRTETVNGKTITTTIVEETVTYPDGREETTVTETVTGGDGGPQESVSKNTRQVEASPSASKAIGNSSSGPQENQDLDQCNQDALKRHNELRAKHGVPPVKLAKDLQEYAQKWAEHMAQKGSLSHSDCTLNGGRLGENVAFTGSSRPTDYAGKDFTDSWYSEIKDHNFGKDHQPGTGHFTQVVWKGTTEVGFGKAKSSDGCRVYCCGSYRPPGNMLGDFKNNVFPPK